MTFINLAFSDQIAWENSRHFRTVIRHWFPREMTSEKWVQKFHIDDFAPPKSVSVDCILRLHIRLHTKSHLENEGRREKRNWSIATRSWMVDEEPQVCIRPRFHKEPFEKGLFVWVFLIQESIRGMGTSFRRNDFWDCLGRQVLLMIG